MPPCRVRWGESVLLFLAFPSKVSRSHSLKSSSLAIDCRCDLTAVAGVVPPDLVNDSKRVCTEKCVFESFFLEMVRLNAGVAE